MKKTQKNDRLFLVFIFVLLIFFCINITSDKGFNIFKKVFPSSQVSVLNFGDVMFDRGVRNIIENRDRDPFEYIKKDLRMIRGYDVIIANLEGPIVVMDRALCQKKAYNFQFAPEITERLKSIGINMVSIANNHSYDCLLKGFESTKKYLKEAGIDYIGDRNLEKSYVIKTINNKVVAFVGIDGLTAPIPVAEFYPLIEKLKKEVDFVVVDIHWGTEYLLTADPNQIAIAHKLIDSGVDVIFGHHPHVVEGVEIYKGKAIFYSLGNFVFDQDFGDTTTGLGVGATFENKKTTFALFPYTIRLFAPDFLVGDEKGVFCKVFLENVDHKGCAFTL